jgi:DNA-binding transcriptional regulator YiaG
MSDQDWETVILKKHQRSNEDTTITNCQKTLNDKNITSDDPTLPVTVDVSRSQRVCKLRSFLKLTQVQLATICSIPISDYKRLESGHLVNDDQAKRLINRVFMKYKKIMLENGI